MSPRAYLLAAASVALFAVAPADARLDQTAPVRFGSKVVRLEQSEAAVRQIAGEPNESIRLLNEFGAPVGRKLVYRQSGYNKRTVIVIVNGRGEVTLLNECMGVKADRCD